MKDMIDVLRFYGRFIKEAYKSIKTILGVWGIVLAGINMVSVLGFSLNKTVVEVVSGEPGGIDPIYAAIPGALAFFHISYKLLQFNYMRFNTIREERDDLRNRISQKMELPNRDALIRALGNVDQTATELLEWQRNLNQLNEKPPNVVHFDATEARERALSKFGFARDTLYQEKLVAGEAFWEPIESFMACVAQQLEEKSSLPPGDLSGIVDLYIKSKETVIRIDDIILGQG